MPPRAASATRALERTDTFMPMKPADAERMPPIAKPIATSMFWSGISATNRTTPTMAIVVYWRRRYADAPSWMAADSVRIVSLPGDSASSDRVVSTPYATAAAAQTTATRTPWSARKSDKETSLESGSSRTHAVGAPCTHAEKAAAAAVGCRRRKRGSVASEAARTRWRAYCPGTQRRPERCAGPASPGFGGGGSAGGSSDGAAWASPALCT